MQSTRPQISLATASFCRRVNSVTRPSSLCKGCGLRDYILHHFQYLLLHGYSSGPEHFWLLLSGQTVAALCNSLMWGATSLLSEMWFPPSERATSSAFGGGISAQLGVMMGYALSPTIVDRSDTNQICGNDTHTPPRDTLHYWEWNEAIFNRLFYYLLGQTVFSLATFLLTLVGALVQMSLASIPVSPPMY